MATGLVLYPGHQAGSVVEVVAVAFLAGGEIDEEMQTAKRFLTSIARMTTPSKYRKKDNAASFEDDAELVQA